MTTKSEKEAMAMFMGDDKDSQPGTVSSPAKNRVMKIEDLKATTRSPNSGHKSSSMQKKSGD